MWMDPQKLTANERDVLAALSINARISSDLLSSWSGLAVESAQTTRTLVDLAGYGVTEEAAAHHLLGVLADFGMVEHSPHGYRAYKTSFDSFKRLALVLDGIAYFTSAVHRDATNVAVVLTKPPQPSALENRLAARGWRTAELEETQHAFHGIARSARSRFVVMSPFLDSKGARWVQELFGVTSKDVDRVLVLRSLEAPDRSDYPHGYKEISAWLKDTGIRVFNYSIPRIGRSGRETFHAKILLCDEHSAYVGSSNMTAASLEHSMEMGVALRGKAAARVAVVVDAVLASADQWS